MNCRIVDMRNKEVINIKDGVRIGVVCDVEVDTATAKLVAIVVYGRPRWWGLLGRDDDIVIPWCDIEIIGDDTVLVNHNVMFRKRSRAARALSNFFGMN